MRRSTRTLALSAAAVLGALLLVKFLVRSMTYPAPPYPVGEVPSGWRETKLTTDHGDEVILWSTRTGAERRLLFLHGNGENLATLAMSGTIEQLAALGVEVSALDFPGYGRSTGTPSEAALIAAGEAALQWLQDEGEGSPVLVCGWSLGAAVAVQLAARNPDSTEALILLSPWASLAAVAERFYPSWLVRTALSDRYDSLGAAPGISRPAFVAHGSRDEIIPFEQGEKVAEALGGPTRWLPVTGAGHNDLLGYPELWRALGLFLSERR